PGAPRRPRGARPQRALPRQGQADRRAVLPGRRRRGPGRHRDQRRHGRPQREEPGPHAAAGAGRAGAARLPARAGLRPRDRRRHHGPAGAPAAAERAVIALQVGALLFLALLSIALAAVEAAFYLVKRRRLSHVAMHNPRAELVNQYMDDPPTLLMPVHMGTYTAHLAMTVVITSLFLGIGSEWALLIAFLSMVVCLLLFSPSGPHKPVSP